MAEKKHHDISHTYNTTLPAPTEGVILALTEVNQGTNDSNRIGDKITGTSLEFKIMSVSAEIAATTDSYWMMRMIIFIWKDDTLPTMADIVTPSGLNITATQPGLWPLNHDKKIKRKVLLDRTITQFNDFSLIGGASYSSAVYNPYYFERFYFPLAKYRRLATINYQSGSVVGVNKIYLLTMTNVPQAALNEHWLVGIVTRYNFIDM